MKLEVPAKSVNVSKRLRYVIRKKEAWYTMTVIAVSTSIGCRAMLATCCLRRGAATLLGGERTGVQRRATRSGVPKRRDARGCLRRRGERSGGDGRTKHAEVMNSWYGSAVMRMVAGDADGTEVGAEKKGLKTGF